MSDYNLPEALLELEPFIKANKLIIMAGSGISVPAGLPTWGQMLSKIIDFCATIQGDLPDNLKFRELLNEARTKVNTDPVKVATVLKDALEGCNRGLPKYQYDIIAKSFKNELSDMFEKDPHENHELIVGTNYPFILTTNYDRLLEKAAQKPYRSLANHSLTYTEAENVAAALYNDTPSIIHLHGDVRGIELDNFVFSMKDYHKVRKGYPGFNLAVQALFMRYTVLFVGYGGSDPHLDEFEEDLAYLFGWPVYPDSPIRHFLSLPQEEAHMLMVRHKRIVNVDIIKLENRDETTKLLRQIQQINPRPASGS